MRRKLYYFLIFFTTSLSAQINFNRYFTGERLRIDYGEAGNSSSSTIFSYHFIKEPVWGGPRHNLIDTFRYGEMLVEVFDSSSSKLIYSRGYSTLFKEWQTVDEAKTKERIFIESIVVPYPKHKVHIVISERTYDLSFVEKFSTYLDPRSISILRDKPYTGGEYRKLTVNGPPENKIDIVFVAEGYTAGQKTKFFNDAARFRDIMLSWAPYDRHQKAFNFGALFVPSKEEGTDIPEDSIWRRTAFNTSFNTFGTHRYLTTEDITGLRDALSGIAYDQICLIVNSDKYGGGGIYNDFTVFTADNKRSDFLFMHEFGHGFASLADEYYSSTVSYQNMFDPRYEPYQPNITTLVDFKHKWADMVPDTVPIPTPDSSIYHHVVGVFEGAGYSSKNVYRPYYDCTMKSVLINAFCPVCQRAIEQLILFYDVDE